ncbi:DUF3263 domain-containing protein [Nocardia xishanensis]|uniref:DUF3263 domain-containing protein n=1 Tax=Nocardia xishanensis TaxID=238964 RepID=A0ABW7XC61_9NOCA
MSSPSTVEDEQNLEYARRWLPYGGGRPEDTLVEFGLTPCGYIARLAAILDSPAARTLDPDIRQALHDFVASHLSTSCQESCAEKSRRRSAHRMGARSQ